MCETGRGSGGPRGPEGRGPSADRTETNDPPEQEGIVLGPSTIPFHPFVLPRAFSWRSTWTPRPGWTEREPSFVLLRHCLESVFGKAGGWRACIYAPHPPNPFKNPLPCQFQSPPPQSSTHSPSDGTLV